MTPSSACSATTFSLSDQGDTMPRKTFVAGDVLTAADMNLLSQDGYVTNTSLDTTAGQPGGAWVSFTPTISGGTHTGTKTGKYIQVGKMVDFVVYLTWDTGSNFSGLKIDLPVTASSSANISSFTVTFGDGPVPYPGTCVHSTADITPYAMVDDTGTSSGYVSAAAVSNTIPFTWAANDTVQIAGRYEAA
jgi:hypothetical protein